MKTETSTNHITPPAAKPLLAAGLIEEGTLEGCFYIWANTSEQMTKRIEILRYDFNFYEVNNPQFFIVKNTHALYVKGHHKDIDELKEKIAELSKVNWFIPQNSWLTINSTDIYCNGKWLI